MNKTQSSDHDTYLMLFSLAKKRLNQITESIENYGVYHQVESCGPYNRSTQLNL